MAFVSSKNLLSILSIFKTKFLDKEKYSSETDGVVKSAKTLDGLTSDVETLNSVVDGFETITAKTEYINNISETDAGNLSYKGKEVLTSDSLELILSRLDAMNEKMDEIIKLNEITHI